MSSNGIEYDWIGGQCPMQAEGTVDGVPFIFRSRGNRWTLEVGYFEATAWSYSEPYGEERFAAGWITGDQARQFVEKAAGIYRHDPMAQSHPTEAAEYQKVTSRRP